MLGSGIFLFVLLFFCVEKITYKFILHTYETLWLYVEVWRMNLYVNLTGKKIPVVRGRKNYALNHAFNFFCCKQEQQ